MLQLNNLSVIDYFIKWVPIYLIILELVGYFDSRYFYLRKESGLLGIIGE